jgi:hypothetical protein
MAALGLARVPAIHQALVQGWQCIAPGATA